MILILSLFTYLKKKDESNLQIRRTIRHIRPGRAKRITYPPMARRPDGLASRRDRNKWNPSIKEAHRQLTAYFAREQKQFDLPIAPEGTPFQLKIWKLLQEIPYGTTITYGELARRSGDIKASRAVGMANSRNPLPILIPCHRVIGSGGKLTGYTGGLNIKIGLLQIEGALDLSLWPESPNYWDILQLFCIFLHSFLSKIQNQPLSLFKSQKTHHETFISIISFDPCDTFCTGRQKYLAGAVPVVDDRVVSPKNWTSGTFSKWHIRHFVTMGDYPFYNHRRAAKPDTLLRSG